MVRLELSYKCGRDSTAQTAASIQNVVQTLKRHMAYIIDHIYMAAARDGVLCINPVSNYIKNYSTCIKQ
jgi:citrate lyase beta subunit